MNTDLREVAKNDFEKDFLKLVNGSVLTKRYKMYENIGTFNLQQ